MKKKAIIFGISGQDGAYLSKLLLEKNYKVYGATRSLSNKNLYRHDLLNTKDYMCLFFFNSPKSKRVD